MTLCSRLSHSTLFSARILFLTLWTTYTYSICKVLYVCIAMATNCTKQSIFNIVLYHKEQSNEVFCSVACQIFLRPRKFCLWPPVTSLVCPLLSIIQYSIVFQRMFYFINLFAWMTRFVFYEGGNTSPSRTGPVSTPLFLLKATPESSTERRVLWAYAIKTFYSLSK